MKKRPQGVTLAELLVFSGLSLLVTLLVTKVLLDYRGLSIVFDQRTKITTSVNVFFTHLREMFELSSNRGVYIEPERHALVVQRIDQASARSSQSWGNELTFVWWNLDKKQVLKGHLLGAEIDPAFQSGAIFASNSERLVQGLTTLQDDPKTVPLLRDVEKLEISRPNPGEVTLSLVIQKKSYRIKTETIERESSFSLLIDEDI